jgi:hypothetical protein
MQTIATIGLDIAKSMSSEDDCVYRKPKFECNGDEVRPEGRVN